MRLVRNLAFHLVTYCSLTRPLCLLKPRRAPSSRLLPGSTIPPKLPKPTLERQQLLQRATHQRRTLRGPPQATTAGVACYHTVSVVM